MISDKLCQHCNHTKYYHPEGKCIFSDCLCVLFQEKREQYRIPEFIELLDASKAIHLKKNADYASDANPFSNFERSSQILEWFTNTRDKGFVALIATKLARIAELGDGRVPNNESIDDTFLDLLTYVGLWAAYRKRFPYQSIVVCPNCNHQGLFHKETGCTFCNCKVKELELYPGSIIRKS